MRKYEKDAKKMQLTSMTNITKRISNYSIYSQSKEFLENSHIDYNQLISRPYSPSVQNKIYKCCCDEGPIKSYFKDMSKHFDISMTKKKKIFLKVMATEFC